MRNKEEEDEMLRSLKSLIGYRIHATDGEMGHVDDFYFDDRDWSVRHIAVDLGRWRYRRQILLAPKAVQDDSMNRVLAVPLTRRQVEGAPWNRHRPTGRETGREDLSHVLCLATLRGRRWLLLDGSVRTRILLPGFAP